MTFQQLLFIGFASLVLGGAVSVVILRNPLYGAFALITSFVGLSALYVTMGAQFIGAAQIVVYAGAIMMLFVFVINPLRPVSSNSSWGTSAGMNSSIPPIRS
ncbi:MAG: NADH-quinone oxidoreductase subunit J, partial [Chloracidobacterium sp.]